jgi:hypothetical protein
VGIWKILLKISLDYLNSDETGLVQFVDNSVFPSCLFQFCASVKDNNNNSSFENETRKQSETG